MTLIPPVHGKLAEQDNWNGIGAVALRRFWQMGALDLTRA
ncbi:hypothetical protein X744_08630 [Mesorhizobium sp. LNJC372A00]|nr:hypothetical protein X753_05640 [Mesorhizobium sp. LNJC399B00]ESY58270.1 hypothetical protein X745_01905 [Mesorhizobium sp. LNJC374B00]ESY60687.1 hypothetical protein X744_08630 [Mesorhizobium sp. LNJC372A00]ESZ58236.1 hypothetical protein X728_21720 [Mesorhizobium sp. L103C120A0]ESZ64777.1 hypothetical protein X729_06495 [Mesorhizobium sp. L103C131B0]